MDKDKLESLRARYAAASADETRDPARRKLLQVLFEGAGKRRLPYAGVPTFLDFPFKEDLANLDIALIGVPMDLGVTNRPGARFGPRALRTIERIGPYHHALKVAPIANHRIADVGDVPFRSRFDLVSSLEDIEAYFAKVVGAGDTLDVEDPVLILIELPAIENDHSGHRVGALDVRDIERFNPLDVAFVSEDLPKFLCSNLKTILL